MDNKKLRKISWGGSVLFHILLVLIIAFTGILHSNKLKEDIVEIAFVGGGGGGGSGNEAAETNTTDIEEAGTETTTPQEAISTEDIITEKKITPQQSSEKKSSTDRVSSAVKPSYSRGTGIGNGDGSGTGSGSGSGDGSGSGHGTGIGSGSGTGTASNPAVPPRIIRSVQPEYPSAERNARIEGTAIVRLLIDTDGSVEEAVIVSSSGNSNLDNAAVNACYKWKFISAKNSVGQKIRCYANLPITFKLR